MIENKNLLPELEKLLKRKKSRKYYAEKLGITLGEVEELISELRTPESTYTSGKHPGEVTSVLQEGLQPEVSVKSERVDSTGDKQVEFVSNRPLTRTEIEELYGIDNITTRLTNYWNKQQSESVYYVSAFVKCLIADFYTEDQLQAKLKAMLVDVVPQIIPEVINNNPKNEGLFIYIADDHCGLILKNSLFKREYSGKTYAERLLKIVQEVKALNKTFESICVVNLGDEMDGYNKKTTRYDHELDSISNKEQFDIFVTARTIFYNELFASGLAENYTIINMNNSNHTGLGFSYMANRALQIYVESKFPNVGISNVEEFVTYMGYGNHVIALTHGKDEKYMKSPFPLNVDAKTEVWFTDYFKANNVDTVGKFVSIMKGDLHKYNVNQARVGRYVNVPSISSGSAWIEHNFGDSKPGALLEIMDEDGPNIISLPIWF